MTATRLAVGLPALAAAALALIATRHGVGVTPDAYYYLDAARHLAAGDGFTATLPCDGSTGPVVHWPPLYPFVLSLGARVGIELTLFARLVQALLFAANVLLVGRILLARTGSTVAAAVGGLLLAVSLGMIEIHTAAWSEPLFLLLGVGGLWWTARAFDDGRWAPLLAGAALVGLAALTRYIGGALIVAIVLAHLVRRRVGRAAVAGVVAALPLALFVVRNALLTGRPVNRAASASSALEWEHLEALLVTAGSWLLPGADRLALVPHQELLVSAVALAGIAAAALAARREPVFGLALALFPALLLVSIARFDRASPLDQRNLSLLVPCLLVVLVPALHRRLAVSRIRATLRTGVALLCAAHAAAALIAVRHLHREGRGYLAPRFDPGPLPDVRLYSNFPDALHLRTGRQACPIERAVTPPAAILYYDDARQFTPRGRAANSYRGGSYADARARAASLGLFRERRHGHAVLFTD
jgi:hypothetical protein